MSFATSLSGLDFFSGDRKLVEDAIPGYFTMGRLLANGYLEIPPENVLATDSGMVYVDVPCYDSPAVLTERRVVVR